MRAGLVLLRITRGFLRRVDSVLTRRMHPWPECGPPPHAAEVAEIEAFFRELPSDDAARGYLDTHLPRLIRTMTLVPRPAGARRVLELGSYMQMTPALNMLCGYPEVRAAGFGEVGQSVRKTVSVRGAEFACDLDLFDAERDRFPHPDGHFSLVLCCEMIEHLMRDPLHMLLEIRRVLEPGGKLLLTTPNCASLTSLASLLHGRRNPQVYSCYSRVPTDERPHVREYTAYEVGELMTAAGFEIEQLFTERVGGSDEANWVRDLLIRNQLEDRHRGEQTYCLAVMRPSLPVDRYPSWLYG